MHPYLRQSVTMNNSNISYIYTWLGVRGRSSKKEEHIGRSVYSQNGSDTLGRTQDGEQDGEQG